MVKGIARIIVTEEDRLPCARRSGMLRAILTYSKVHKITTSQRGWTKRLMLTEACYMKALALAMVFLAKLKIRGLIHPDFYTANQERK